MHAARKRLLAFIFTTLLLLVAGPANLFSQQRLPHGDAGAEMTLVLAGDAIITRRLSVFDEPEFLALRELVQGATAAFVNLEILFHNFEPDIIPASASGGTYMQADPAIAEELVWMGFDMVSMANNHTGDYGVGALRSTTRAVDAVGLMHAGTGENLAEARAPGYLETPRGRVALISAASTFPDGSRAGHQRKDVRGRPGLSPIRYNTVYQVTQGQMDALRSYREGTGSSRGEGDRLRLFGESFQVGNEYRSLTTPHEGDLAEIVASVNEAKRQANLVIFSHHTHESGLTNNYPADFIVTVAHAVIDAGADIFLAHGPHVLRGIEIYKGKPIFYSLGDFLFQNETVPRQPADSYENYGLGSEAVAPDFFDARQRTGGFPSRPQVWESFVAMVRFQGGELAGVELHPITLGHGLDRPQRGRPLLATGELARKIIDETREYSQPFGTDIAFENGIGVIRFR
jgi:poly-gamma-glutamate capsule biosynthesis protein CapA/YwtB (metallophosphatase superfamily)